MTNGQKKKVAIVHPQLKAGGGSEAVAAWVIESLKNDYELTVITMGSVDTKSLNDFYHTNLQPGDFRLISLEVPKLFKNRFDALRDFRLHRFARKSAGQFDVMISTYNVMDFGKRGIQCIADLSFDDNLRRMVETGSTENKKWFYQKSILRRLYLLVGRVLSGNYKKGWKQNITIANSGWTRRILQQYHQLDSQVIYPPVFGDFPEVPWDQKENSFVYLGRISPEKQIEKIISILQRVKERHYAISLRIIGKLDGSAYSEYIKRVCNGNRDWCTLEGQMAGQKKIEAISKYKYGISARPNEPFGIAVAELSRAGCVVFVPEGGGQAEIVGEMELMYQSEDEAVEKITHLMRDKELQIKLWGKLSSHSKTFSVERFQESMRRVVEDFLKTSNRP
jgi:glycosyltransferase involved in cell wall biosynthesis